MTKKAIPPTVLLIFGATGDLSTKKLIPALYELERAGRLPDDFYIFGATHKTIKVTDVATTMGVGFKPSSKQVFKKLMSRVRLIRFDINDDNDYERLKTALQGFQEGKKVDFNVAIYLDVPQDAISAVMDKLAAHKLNRAEGNNGSQCRLLIEKPYGSDLAPAKRVIKSLRSCFKEKNIFRVDTALTKESVTNILTLREQNPWLRAVWSAKHIKAIDISVYHRDGVNWRSEYFDNTGALRDMIKDHLLQLLAITTMHVPDDITPESLANARLNLLKHIKTMRRATNKKALRAQYQSYLKDTGKAKSTTETFASVPVVIDRAGWRNTRIKLSAGLSMERDDTHIAIWFSNFAKQENKNVLLFRLRPEAGLGITLLTNKPGSAEETEYITLSRKLPKSEFEDPYVSALQEAFAGDRSIFSTSEEILESWRVVNPLVKKWYKKPKPVAVYKSGEKPQKVLAT